MSCERPSEIIGIGTVESVDSREPTETAVADISTHLPTVRPTTSTTELVTSTTLSTTTVAVSSTTEQRRTAPTSSTYVPTSRPTAARTGNVVVVRTTPSPPKQSQEHIQQHQPRPPLVLGSPLYKSKSNEDIVVKDVLRNDNAIIIYWDTEVTNILGFKVIYRLFGDNNFKQAPPLEASEREFKIKNVPTQVKRCFFTKK